MFAQPLQAQDTRATAAPADASAPEAAPANTSAPSNAFEVEINAPAEVKELFQRHLELLRYRELTDLDRAEFERLLVAAERDARQLLATLGYFSPEVMLQLRAAPEPATTKPTVIVSVLTGAPTQVGEVAIKFSGAIADDPSAAPQRAAIRGGWLLPSGLQFTQARWDAAKTQAVRLLTGQRYAGGQITASRADIDAATATARLQLTLDSGPVYHLGPMLVTGLERHDATMVERLAQLKPGEVYDQSVLAEARQRLQDSGFFDSVFLSLDTSGDPAAAPVLAQLREAQTSKLVLGLGYSTDSRLRLTAEHTNHQLPLIGWRSVSNLMLDSNTQSIGINLIAAPDASHWRWVASGLLKQDDSSDVKVSSLSLRAGRSQFGRRIDRNYSLQYDIADTTNALDRTTRGQSVSANYAWTQRNFDSLPFPSDGYGLGADFGGGWTLGDRMQPFGRMQLRWLGIWPLAALQAHGTGAHAGRIALRAQAGAVVASTDALLPGNQLFLTGGSTSVRGYAYNSIGATGPTGQTSPGRYLAVGSVEWQQPIVIDGQPGDWEGAVFVDTGAVADKPSALKAQVGIGAGVRWRSPLGPLQLDLAYGIQVKQWRSYLSVGFTF